MMNNFVVINDEKHRIEGWKIALEDENVKGFTSPRQFINFCKANPDFFPPDAVFIFDRMYGTYDLTEDQETWRTIKAMLPATSKFVISSFTVQEGQKVDFDISADLTISGKAMSKSELMENLNLLNPHSAEKKIKRP